MSVKYEEEQCRKGDDRKDVPHQRRRFKSAAQAKHQSKDQRVERAHDQVSKHRKEDQTENI